MATPARYNFRIYQGQTWDQTLTLRNSDGTAMNLTGYKARLQARIEIDDEEPVLDLTYDNGKILVTTPLSGIITILVSAADTAALDLDYEPQEYIYDLEIYRESPSPTYVVRVLEGVIIAFPEVTR